jgi:hypothetical protein
MEYVPGGQGEHVEEPLDEDVPAGQGLHSAADVELETFEKLPGGHGRHICAPTSGTYVPAGHGKHVEDPRKGAYEPLAQSTQGLTPYVADKPTTFEK